MIALMKVEAMTPKIRLSLDVRQAILGHLCERLDAKTVSISSAMKAVHTMVPRCSMTDAQLTNLIAETALEAGFGVNFDSKAN